MLSNRPIVPVDIDAETANPRGHIWRERELWCVVALVLAIYLPRLTTLSVRGEESRWARVAQEMRESGDWIVPRQQGQPFVDRPPLGSWAILAASYLSGDVDLVAVRLPSVLAVLATALLIYGYCRPFLSRFGSLAAAIAYPTMSQVLQLGRLGENDALLALFVSSSLLIWHSAYELRHDARTAWCAGYLMAALAALIKGPQGPVYFVASTGIYLAMRRDWRFLFNRWHLVGATLGITTIAAWQVPFVLALDPSIAGAVWNEGGELTQRFAYHGIAITLRHWGLYPFELFACMLPWSFMLSPLATRWFGDNLGRAKPVVSFLITCSAVALPTCWLPAETRPRYFMPLYPCIAILCGIVIARSRESTAHGWWPQSWDRFLRVATPLIAVSTLCIVGMRIVSIGDFSEAISTLTVCAVALAAPLAIGALWVARHHASQAALGALACAGFWGLFSTGAVVDAQKHASNDPSREIARIRSLVPHGESLVSFRPIHHLFAFYYRDPIAVEMVPDDRAPADFAGTYFCYGVAHDTPPVEMPFPWEEVTQISCERVRSSHPRTKVIVGRRLSRAEPPLAARPVARMSATRAAGEPIPSPASR